MVAFAGALQGIAQPKAGPKHEDSHISNLGRNFWAYSDIFQTL